VPRFLPTLGRPHAVALRFIRCGQLKRGLSPLGWRPCWAHKYPATTCAEFLLSRFAETYAYRREQKAL
ncbi:hypothetical protein, partial [Pseudomonas sp. F01002]|uniref:hypothetical protein n=1 Tax=Pseudomonas sp. F01002 TaxID=2555724 RepID=UPI001C498D68